MNYRADRDEFNAAEIIKKYEDFSQEMRLRILTNLTDRLLSRLHLSSRE